MRLLKPALVALAFVLAQPALAQVPRAPDGKPDLSGIWTNASLTPLSRSPAQKSTVPVLPLSSRRHCSPLMRT